MTPKPTNKVRKRSPTKTPTKPGPVRDVDMKKSLLFLWLCFKSANAHVDIASVADQLKIKPGAAQARFSRLKKKLDEMEATENIDESPLPKVDNGNTEVKTEAGTPGAIHSDENLDADFEDDDEEYKPRG